MTKPMDDYFAYFSQTLRDTRKGFAAVRARYGEAGVNEVRRSVRKGAMAIFDSKETPARRHYVATVAAAVRARLG